MYKFFNLIKKLTCTFVQISLLEKSLLRYLHITSLNLVLSAFNSIPFIYQKPHICAAFLLPRLQPAKRGMIY